MTNIENLDQHQARDEASDVSCVRNATLLRPRAKHTESTD
jgi:hypothetical protein